MQTLRFLLIVTVSVAWSASPGHAGTRASDGEPISLELALKTLSLKPLSCTPSKGLLGGEDYFGCLAEAGEQLKTYLGSLDGCFEDTNSPYWQEASERKKAHKAAIKAVNKSLKGTTTTNTWELLRKVTTDHSHFANVCRSEVLEDTHYRALRKMFHGSSAPCGSIEFDSSINTGAALRRVRDRVRNCQERSEKIKRIFRAYEFLLNPGHSKVAELPPTWWHFRQNDDGSFTNHAGISFGAALAQQHNRLEDAAAKAMRSDFIRQMNVLKKEGFRCASAEPESFQPGKSVDWAGAKKASDAAMECAGFVTLLEDRKASSVDELVQMLRAISQTLRPGGPPVQGYKHAEVVPLLRTRARSDLKRQFDVALEQLTLDAALEQLTQEDMAPLLSLTMEAAVQRARQLLILAEEPKISRCFAAQPKDASAQDYDDQKANCEALLPLWDHELDELLRTATGIAKTRPGGRMPRSGKRRSDVARQIASLKSQSGRVLKQTQRALAEEEAREKAAPADCKRLANRAYNKPLILNWKRCMSRADLGSTARRYAVTDEDLYIDHMEKMGMKCASSTGLKSKVTAFYRGCSLDGSPSSWSDNADVPSDCYEPNRRNDICAQEMIMEALNKD